MKLDIKNLFSWIIFENIFTTLTSFFIFFYLETVIFYTAIIMISYRFSDFGFANQLIKENDNLVHEKFLNLFIIDVFFNIIVFFLLTILSYLILEKINFLIFFIINISILLNNINSFFKTYFQKQFHFKFLFIIKTIINLFVIILTVYFSTIFQNYYLIVLPNFLLQLVLFFFFLIYLKKLFVVSNFSFQFKKNLNKQNFSYFFFGICEETFLRIDYIFLNLFFDKFLLGIYEKIFQYGNILNNFVGNIIIQFIYPYFGASFVKNKKKDFIFITKVSFYLFSMFSLIYYYFFTFIIDRFFDNEWKQILVYFYLIIPFSILYAIYQNLKNYVIVNMNLYIFAKLELLRLIIFISLIILFLKIFGFIGIFYALNISMIISLILLFLFINKEIDNYLFENMNSIISTILVVFLFMLGSIKLKVLIPFIFISFIIADIRLFIKKNK
jgi:O-antigen/teichoic acid export membrane protein